MNISILPEGTTLGSDPEFMVYDKAKGRIVSAIDVLNNNKYSPVVLAPGYLLYADNVMAELAFPPSSSPGEFLITISRAIKMAHAHLGDRYVLLPLATHRFLDEDMQDPRAREAGCSPNFSAWTDSVNQPPKFTDNLRTGSFHIHIGHPSLLDRQAKLRMVKLLDRYLGLAALIWDTDSGSITRRLLYGQAGEYRPTDYGVEYRVLGPYTILHPTFVMQAVIQIGQAFAAMDKPETEPYQTGGLDNELIRRSINEGNVQDAIDTYPGIVFPENFEGGVLSLLGNWSEGL